MGDPQTRLAEGQNGRLWREGGELFGKIVCGATAAYYGAGRVGILVASQLCGEIFGEIGSQVPSLFRKQAGQPRQRPQLPLRQRGQRRRRPSAQGQPRPTTPQELFTLQQQGYDPLGQIPGIPTRQSVPRDRTQPGSVSPGQGPSDSAGQGPFIPGGQPTDQFGQPAISRGIRPQQPLQPTGRQGSLRARPQPSLTPISRQPPTTFPTDTPTLPPGFLPPSPQPGDPYGFFTPDGRFILFPGQIIFPHTGPGLFPGFIIRGIGTLGPFFGLPPGGA